MRTSCEYRTNGDLINTLEVILIVLQKRIKFLLKRQVKCCERSEINRFAEHHLILLAKEISGKQEIKLWPLGFHLSHTEELLNHTTLFIHQPSHPRSSIAVDYARRTPASLRFFSCWAVAELMPTFWLASRMLWASRRCSSRIFFSFLSVLPAPLPLPWN